MTLPDRSYRWLIVAYTLVIQAVSVGILVYCFTLFAVPWLDDFGAPRRDVMLAVAVLQIGMGVCSPVAGRLMDQYPLRYLVCAGVAAMVVGLVLVANARALWQVLLVYATLFPLAMALAGTLAAQTLVAKWFTDKRGLAIGISAMGTNVGGIVFPLVVASSLVTFGWRDTLLWLAFASLLLVVPLTWVVLRRTPDRLAGSATGQAPAERLWTTREILTAGLFWIPVLAMLPLNIAFGAVQFNLGAFSRDLGLTPDEAANLVALSSVCMIAGKFFFGGFGDRLDHRLLYWIAAAFMVVALVLLLGKPGSVALIAGVVCMGLAGGGILPLFGVVFGSRFGAASFGRVMGFVMLTITAGSVGPLLAGWVHDATGSYDAAFIAMAVLIVPLAALMWRLPS